MADQTAKKPVTVIGLRTRNILGVSLVEIKPPPVGIVELAGPNGAGKSSTINSFFLACQRAKPGVIALKQGTDGGDIQVDFGDFKVYRSFDRDGDQIHTKLLVTNKDGRPYSSPVEMLSGLMSKISHDPDAMMDLTPKERMAMFCKILQIDVDRLNMEIETAKETAKEAEKETKRIELRNVGLPTYPDAPTEIQSVEALSKELSDAYAHNKGTESYLQELVSLKDKREVVFSNQKTQLALIEDYNLQLKALLAKIEECKSRVDACFSAVNQVDKQINLCERKISEFKPIDTAELETKVRNVEQINNQVRANQAREEARQEFARQERIRVEAVRKVEDLESEKRNAIRDAVKKAKLHFPDVELRDDLYVGGLPYGQLNSAKQRNIVIDLATVVAPAIRVLHAPHYEKLTKESRAELEQIAIERGFQLWVETAASREEIENGEVRVGEHAFYIEDGHVAPMPEKRKVSEE